MDGPIGDLNPFFLVMKTYRPPLLLIIFAFAFASSALAQSAQTLWVPARYSNEVAVIDTYADQVVTQIAVGDFPIRRMTFFGNIRVF